MNKYDQLKKQVENVESKDPSIIQVKNSIIIFLEKKVLEKDKEINLLKKKLDRNQTSKYPREAAKVFSRWSKIRKIIQSRKHCFSINEYLELKPILNLSEDE